ncbi:hypothetical protein [Pseudomarimonas salicorniae]|uniref:Uncharacterized protein n=1 Tax=Pseudomarimonas salicorniae TaxID=2933270 RepID=A0ABT0GH61_9GAMM|nr:hypothetical protein [Lysobacter sp. CAU 1642]MCK7593872.1 hypothetical protein [Lysobacter sp. CAU 1642]
MLNVARGLVAALLLASASAAPGISLNVGEPGFVALDGTYYAYGLRTPAPAITGFAAMSMLGQEGFYLQSVMDTGSCQRGDGSPATLAGAGQPRLRFADTPLSAATPPEGIALARMGTNQLAGLGVASCGGINVLLLSSLDGDLRCGLGIRFPFERGDCPGLDAADPTYISHGGFE